MTFVRSLQQESRRRWNELQLLVEGAERCKNPITEVMIYFCAESFCKLLLPLLQS